MADRFYRTWEADRPRAVVALVHGLAEHSGRYEHVAARLSAEGYTVVAVDLTGHGRSPGRPGEVSGLSDWVGDAEALVERARSLADGRPVFLLGHSLGALVAASYAAGSPGAVDGLVLSAPAVLVGDAYLEAATRGEGVPPAMISRDPRVVEAYVSDPLVFYDRLPPEANAAALEAAIETNQSAPRITTPILLLHGSADRIADPEGTRDLFAALGSPDKRLEVYEGLYHEVMNEPERDRVLDDVVAWLHERTPD